MAIKCPQCQHVNPPDTIYCGKCATPLPSKKKIPATKTLETPVKELTRGTTFASRYEIIEELGKGGMGEVYRVEDKKIKEEVALKLIKPEVASDKKTIERFSNELKMARKIRHKNVCAMFDLGEEKGTHYITMEYVRGENLKSSIRRMGPLTAGKTLFIAKQICEGLSEAHRLRVVHRDLKPQNIMIDRDGNARIMDFGIARTIKGKGITGAGVMIGTPEYMSPEQAEVKDVDQRSDIYSLGVILYEMVTGRVPFDGETPLSIAMKHKSEEPQNPGEINAQIPEGLTRLILRCMEKNKDNRYQSAEELRAELENIEKGIPTTEKVVPKRKPITSKEITVTFGLKKLILPFFVISLLTIIVVMVWRPWSPREAGLSYEYQYSIAVLPFEDLSTEQDQSFFCEGMTEDLITKLTNIEGLKVISRPSIMHYKGTQKDMRTVGKELSVNTILKGRIQKEGNRLRITVQLINVEDGSHLWADSYDRELASLFVIQDEISRAVVNALRIELGVEQEYMLAKRHTEDHRAHELYLKGRSSWEKRTKEGLESALEFFQQAINRDSGFSKAYIGIADSFNMLGSYDFLPPQEAYPKAKEMALKALELDDSLAEAYTSLAWIKYRYEWDWFGAETDFNWAIGLNPRYSTAHLWYGTFLQSMGRFGEAKSELDKAKELDPFSMPVLTSIARLYYHSRQYDLAIEQCRQVLDKNPRFHWAHNILAASFLQKFMFKEAIQEFKEAIDLSEKNTSYKADLAHAYAVSGLKQDAKIILEELLSLALVEHVPKCNIALIYAALGDRDTAFRFFDEAFEERSTLLLFLNIDPRLDIMRSDMRFAGLLEKVGLYELRVNSSVSSRGETKSTESDI
jgi:serine/threonine-protein kinase